MPSIARPLFTFLVVAGACARMRTAVVRGGSAWQPQGSIRCFPPACRNDEHGRLLPMAPSRERSGMVDFRCVIDAKVVR